MLTTTFSRLSAFAATVAAAAGIAAVAGGATGATPPFQDCLKNAAPAAEDMGMATDEGMAKAIPGAHGLTAELAGVRLEPQSRTLPAGGSATWRFRIMGCAGEPVRDFDPELGKLLHLIVVRSDFTGYQPLPPVLGRDGTLSTRIATPAAGR